MARERLPWWNIDPDGLPDEVRAAYDKAVAASRAAEKARKSLEEAGYSEPVKFGDDDGKAPCSNCLTKTFHNVLHAEKREFGESFGLIECAGCKRISLAHAYLVCGGSGEDRWEEHWIDYYPSPLARRQPSWLATFSLSGPTIDSDLRVLLVEIYEALSGGQHRLAAMGIRALIEQVMIAKVDDHGSFHKNLDAFCDKGFASPVQRDAIKSVLDAGHAAMHRNYNPTESDLNTALDVVEGILASIYVHTDSVRNLAARVPARNPIGKIIPWKDRRRVPHSPDEIK